MCEICAKYELCIFPPFWVTPGYAMSRLARLVTPEPKGLAFFFEKGGFGGGLSVQAGMAGEVGRGGLVPAWLEPQLQPRGNFFLRLRFGRPQPVAAGRRSDPRRCWKHCGWRHGPPQPSEARHECKQMFLSGLQGAYFRDKSARVPGTSFQVSEYQLPQRAMDASTPSPSQAQP